jgi:hypothetical protein
LVVNNFPTAGDQNPITSNSSEKIPSQATINVSPDGLFGCLHHQPPTQRNTADPRTWTATDVCDWLKSNDIPDHIIQVFKNERINGKSLFLLSFDNFGAMGVTAFGERLELKKLISDLKEKWTLTTDEKGSTVGAIVGAGSGSVRTEDGKGVPAMDAPPSYNAL